MTTSTGFPMDNFPPASGEVSRELRLTQQQVDALKEWIEDIAAKAAFAGPFGSGMFGARKSSEEIENNLRDMLQIRQGHGGGK